MANEKIYCGSGKSNPQYDMVNIDVCIEKIPKEFISTDKNGNTWLKLTVSKRKETDQYGKTHTVTVNTWKPISSSIDTHSNNQDSQDLPF